MKNLETCSESLKMATANCRIISCTHESEMFFERGGGGGGGGWEKGEGFSRQYWTQLPPSSVHAHTTTYS